MRRCVGRIVSVLPVVTTICNAFYAPAITRIGRGVAPQAFTDGEPQVLRFVEPKSERPVVLIGAMHYNPRSISLSEDIVKELAESRSLEAVILESCPTRWEKGETLRAQLSESEEALYSAVFENEMQAAATIAEQYSLPIVLGDQPIEITNERVKATAVDTFKDLVSPLSGGWSRIADDVALALGVLTGSTRVPRLSCQAGLTFADFFEFSLIRASPASLLRYPLSIFVRYPFFAFSIFAALITLTFLPELSLALPSLSSDVSQPELSEVESISSIVFSIGFSIIETAVLGRILLNPILAERNVALADSIIDVCAKPSPDGKKTVVAVLGMAHCNGVKGLIESEFRRDKEMSK